MDSFTTLHFVSVSLIPSLMILYLVVKNDFLKDMISVLDIFYPFYQKIKVIVRSISIRVYPLQQQFATLKQIPVIQIFSF